MSSCSYYLGRNTHGLYYSTFSVQWPSLELIGLSRELLHSSHWFCVISSDCHYYFPCCSNVS